MPVRSRLFLKISAIANAVALVVGLICYQSRLIFPAAAVSQSDLNAAFNERRGSDLQSPTSGKDGAKPGVLASHTEQDEYQLVDAATIIDDDLSSSDVVGPIIPAGLVIAGGTPTKQVDYEAIRRRPEPASQELLLHDSVDLMWSSSKSMVIEPRTPEEKQKAIDRYISAATSSFKDLDLNRDGQLAEGEVEELYWKHFKQQGAVVIGTVNFEGFLKNYVWYRSQYDRIHRRK